MATGVCACAFLHLRVCACACSAPQSRPGARGKPKHWGHSPEQGRTSCTQERHQWVSLPSDPACWGLPQCVTPSRALAGGAWSGDHRHTAWPHLRWTGTWASHRGRSRHLGSLHRYAAGEASPCTWQSAQGGLKGGHRCEGMCARVYVRVRMQTRVGAVGDSAAQAMAGRDGLQIPRKLGRASFVQWADLPLHHSRINS